MSKSDDNRRKRIDNASSKVRNLNASSSELLSAMAVFDEFNSPTGDLLAIARRVLAAEPDNEVASRFLFHRLWDCEQFDEAIGEIDRFSNLTFQDCYEPIASNIFDVFGWRLGPAPQSDEGNDDEFGLKSRHSRGLKPRYSGQRNPIDHLKGLERKQGDIRSKGHNGLVDSVEKSKQSMQNELNRIKSVADVHDSPVTFSKEEE